MLATLDGLLTFKKSWNCKTGKISARYSLSQLLLNDSYIAWKADILLIISNLSTSWIAFKIPIVSLNIPINVMITPISFMIKLYFAFGVVEQMWVKKKLNSLK